MTIAVTEYLDPIYKVSKTSDIVYTTNPINSGLLDDGRLLDMFEPTALLYTSTMGGAGAAPVASNRPLLIYAHGGSFVAGSKTNGEADYVCREFAARGWKSVSLNYRMSATAQWPARAILGIEDMRAAIRWARANAGTYLFDTNKIVACGSSAGGGIATFSALGDATWEFNNGNFGAWGNPTVPNGVLNLWGVFIDIYNVNQSLTAANAALGRADNTISIHGTADTTVPKTNSDALDFVIRSNSPTNHSALIPLDRAGHEPWDDWRTKTPPVFYQDAKDGLKTAFPYFKTRFGL